MKRHAVQYNYLYILVFLLVVACTAPMPAVAGDEVPGIVISGLNAYKSGGAEAAMKAWLKGGALETSVETLSQANALKQIESIYGPYIGYEIIEAKDVTKTSKIVYLSLNYQKGPVFARFMAYRSGNKWILPDFDFNTKAYQILPASFWQ